MTALTVLLLNKWPWLAFFPLTRPNCSNYQLSAVNRVFWTFIAQTHIRNAYREKGKESEWEAWVKLNQLSNPMIIAFIMRANALSEQLFDVWWIWRIQWHQRNKFLFWCVKIFSNPNSVDFGRRRQPNFKNDVIFYSVCWFCFVFC